MGISVPKLEIKYLLRMISVIDKAQVNEYDSLQKLYNI